VRGTSPEYLIENTDKLLSEITSQASRLRLECEDIGEVWEALGRIGGQRADAAAELLGRLRHHLAGLSRFASSVEGQITGLIANPFQREDK
jgi:hypothetical protein